MAEEYRVEDRGFILCSEEWWAKSQQKPIDTVDQVYFGIYPDGGGTTGEMVMSWHNLGRKYPSPRLEVYHDGWAALWSFRDLLETLARFDGHGTSLSPVSFCAMLIAHNFKDRTERTRPEPALGQRKLTGDPIYFHAVKRIGEAQDDLQLHQAIIAARETWQRAGF